jgi:transcriptional regulator with XRE-family HTH domain
MDVVPTPRTRLAERRRELGISMEELSLRAGVDRTYLGRVENLKRRPSGTWARKVARRTGLQWHELQKAPLSESRA